MIFYTIEYLSVIAPRAERAGPALAGWFLFFTKTIPEERSDDGCRVFIKVTRNDEKICLNPFKRVIVLSRQKSSSFIFSVFSKFFCFVFVHILCLLCLFWVSDLPIYYILEVKSVWNDNNKYVLYSLKSKTLF